MSYFSKFKKKLTLTLKESGPINIVCLGDSVTQGCFDGPHIDSTVAYPGKLYKMLDLLYPNKNFNIINAGIAETSATFAVSRFKRDVLDRNPDLVLIMFGLNDFGNPQLYAESLDNMFKQLNEKEIPCIYITENMMNTYVSNGFSEGLLKFAELTSSKQNDGSMDKLFELGKKVANENNIAVCDMYSKWKLLANCDVDTTRLLANKINHPIPEMHTALAYEIINVILSQK